jgi:CBS domain containing-hemolysin-like protein
MEQEVPTLFRVILVFVLIAANGFFVAVEFALVRSHLTKLRGPDMKGKVGVSSSLKLSENLDLSLSATQLGITISSLVLGWWGAITFREILGACCRFLGEAASNIVSSALATVFALVIVTFLHVILGELVAKSLAIRFPEGTLRILAGPMRLFAILFRPMIVVMTGCSNLFLRFVGVRTPPDAERVHSLAELAMLVSQSSEQGVIDKTEEEMLHGVFSFSETVAREVMTPRPDLITIPLDSSLESVVEAFARWEFSRLPVVGESVDDIVGIVLIRDVLPFIGKERPAHEFYLKKVMREPYFVPGTKPIDDLLNEFKRRNVHIAIVLDEHGGVDGAVTLEDVLEEIVGEIFDESDIPERDIVVQENGDVIVDGGVLVADINDRLEFEIPEGDYDTIAGFIYTSLGRMPRSGDEISIGKAGQLRINGEDLLPKEVEDEVPANGNGHDTLAEDDKSPITAHIKVESVRGRRIETVRLQRLSELAETSPSIPSSQDKGISSD